MHTDKQYIFNNKLLGTIEPGKYNISVQGGCGYLNPLTQNAETGESSYIKYNKIQKIEGKGGTGNYNIPTAIIQDIIVSDINIDISPGIPKYNQCSGQIIITPIN